MDGKLFWIAIDCGDPRSNLTSLLLQFESGSAPSQFIYLSSINIICISGYKLVNGASFDVMTCTASAIWNSVAICNGEFLDNFC